jgi:aminoglycoside 3-N-acetyltransferase
VRCTTWRASNDQRCGGADLEPPYITHSRLTQDFRALGVSAGDLVMLHASVKSVGWIVGGPDVVLQALLDVLTPAGTLMMYVGWNDGTQEMDSWPEERRRAYEEECPPFNPATSRAVIEWSVLTERLRTWPGARRSANPEASVAAVGAKAEWITANHPLQYGYGPGSPLERLVDAGGKVLLLGSPFSNVTLLHYAESVARIPGKRVTRYRVPVLEAGRRVWKHVEEFDTTDGIVEWKGEDYFGLITREFIEQGGSGVATGRVGNAEAYLLDAGRLHRFAVAWMEGHFV